MAHSCLVSSELAFRYELLHALPRDAQDVGGSLHGDEVVVHVAKATNGTTAALRRGPSADPSGILFCSSRVPPRGSRWCVIPSAQRANIPVAHRASSTCDFARFARNA
jgi:hypothetical protein